MEAGSEMQLANQENELRMALDRQRRNAGGNSLKDEIDNWVPIRGVNYIEQNHVRSIQGYITTHTIIAFSHIYPLAYNGLIMGYYRENVCVKEISIVRKVLTQTVYFFR